MANNEVNDSDIELLPSKFRLHDFEVQAGEVKLSCHLVAMPGSLYLWIGDCKEGELKDMSFGFMSPYEITPVATKLMGSMDDMTSSNIAKRLTMKYAIPAYVSFNTAANHFSMPAIERGIHKELEKHPELLASS